MCGVNDIHQLGIENTQNSNDHIYNKDDIFNNNCYDIVKPVTVESFLKMKVKKLSCGESHSLAVSNFVF